MQVFIATITKETLLRTKHISTFIFSAADLTEAVKFFKDTFFLRDDWDLIIEGIPSVSCEGTEPVVLHTLGYSLPKKAEDRFADFIRRSKEQGTTFPK